MRHPDDRALKKFARSKKQDDSTISEWSHWIRVSTLSMHHDPLKVMSSVQFLVEEKGITIHEHQGLVILGEASPTRAWCVTVMIIEDYLHVHNPLHTLLPKISPSKKASKAKSSVQRSTGEETCCFLDAEEIRVVVISMGNEFPRITSSIRFRCNEESVSIEEMCGDVMVSNGETEKADSTTLVLFVEDHDESYLPSAKQSKSERAGLDFD